MKRVLAVGILAMLSACVGAPVQEMSDARQAIAAAREAGAAEMAADNLQLAETRLAEAEVQLQDHMYWNAKKLALAAKESAIAALLYSRSEREEAAAATPAAPSR
jgi:hypothetical protein